MVDVVEVQERLRSEPYWFHKIDLGNGIITPGWCDPASDRLPYFGLPDSMAGLRVLDIGCAEGFFTFEALRRGASEVISLDFDPECIKRFALCADVLGFSQRARLMSIYDLDPADLGQFDLVMFFGLLYHLPDPVLALRKIAAVTRDMLLLQCWAMEVPGSEAVALARFYPKGVWSGPSTSPILDDTVFWQPNEACIRSLLEHVGFAEIRCLPGAPDTRVSRFASLAHRRRGAIRTTSVQIAARVGKPECGP